MAIVSARELLQRHGIDYVDSRKGKYTTKCPDCSGSYLNVELKKDGVVWFCQSCEKGHGERFEQPDGESGSGLGSIKAIYDYNDEYGKLLFQVLRFEPLNAPKQFRQRTGPDQRKWSIKGVRIVPFKLPELIEATAQDQVVCVCEGEKDVLTLQNLGIPATCNPMGAGKWRADFNQFFRGADVLICIDNDAPGHEHGRLVAENLIPVAKRVRLLNLAKHWPKIEPSDDVSDWLEQGGTVEALWSMVDHLPTLDQVSKLNGFGKPNGKEQDYPLFAYNPRPFAQIPPRQWLHAKHYIRRHVVMTVAPGGYGKSSLLLLNAIELATGRGLLGPAPRERVRTAYWNAEEAEPEEIERRIAAICIAHHIDPNELDGWLFLGLKVTGDEFRFAGLLDQKIAPNTALIEKITDFISKHGIGVLILDPMVQFHRVQEIDTAAMESLVKDVLQPIAFATNCCIELSHHTRKGNGTAAEITADDSRGAGAAINAARSVRVLNRMTKAEAEAHGVKDEDRRLHLRISRDKTNMAPPGKARWMLLASVNIGNETATLPADNVQAAMPWNYPKAFDGITPETMHFIRAQVAKNSYRKDVRSSDWIGNVLLQHLGLNAEDKNARSRARVILDVWFGNGVLATEQRHDGNRRMREYVIPGNWKDMEAETLQPSFLD